MNEQEETTFLDTLETYNLKQRLSVLKKLQQQASYIKDSIDGELNAYFRAICAAKGYKGHSYYAPDSFEIEENCIRFFLEINTACHCHPEMETVEFELPLNLLDMTPDEVEKHLAEQARIEKNRIAAQQAEAKMVAEEREKAKQLEQEKKQYEELKKKFEVLGDYSR
jgi:hypothetical protein